MRDRDTAPSFAIYRPWLLLALSCAVMLSSLGARPDSGPADPTSIISLSNAISPDLTLEML